MKLFYNLFKLFVVAAIAGAALYLSWGCASSGLYRMSDEWCHAHPNASTAQCLPVPDTTYCRYGMHPGDPACNDSWQSWDQDNLKRNDFGCPTAIYVAPGGILRLCEPGMRREMQIPGLHIVVESQQISKFDTLNEAAVRALENAYRISHYYEVGGVLGKFEGKYTIGRPVSDVSGASIGAIEMDPLAYNGMIIATYHTHPCNSNTHLPSVFSPNDTHLDRSYKVIGFMADLCTGKVTKYDPAVDVGADAASPEGWAGHVVGQFTVDGVVLDEHLREAL